MEFKDSDRLRTRLLAIDLRLAELNHEMHRTQVRVNHLESALEDARLARLMGEEQGDATALGSELEKSRGSLESQREFIAQVKKILWTARVEHMLIRAQERRDERERAQVQEAD